MAEAEAEAEGEAEGIMVGCLPGVAERRIADPHPGGTKTNARDEAMIAEVAPTAPLTLRSFVVVNSPVPR